LPKDCKFHVLHVVAVSSLRSSVAGLSFSPTTNKQGPLEYRIAFDCRILKAAKLVVSFTRFSIK
jgi:hypothetical protein